MTSTHFTTRLLGLGNNTGTEVPAANVDALGAGRRPPVTVEVNGYVYASTVAVMGGKNLVPFAKSHREATGLVAGDDIEVTLTLEEGPRSVAVPEELRLALEAAAAQESFDALSYSRRKELARQVDDAKTEATKQRRIAKILAEL
jgi:hypothetical protein